MPKYLYKAKKDLNDTIEGVMEESTQEAVVDRLAALGLIPVSVVLEERAPSASAPSRPKPRLVKKKISLKDISVFTRQLYTLTKSRVELLSSLRILQEQQGNLVFKNLIQDLHENVKDGLNFSQALSKYPDIFSRLYINIIASGEASGKLDDALDQLCIYLGRIEDLRMKLRQALAYPLLMVCVGFVSIFVLVTFVIPRLAVMFNDLEMTLPLSTRIILRLSTFLKDWWPVVTVSFAAVAYFFMRGGIGRSRLIFLGQLKYRIPVIKRLFYEQTIINFSTTLSLLLRSGVSLLEALRISAPLVGDRRLNNELELAREQVKAGSSLSQGLESSRLLPPFLLHMIRVGEEGGRLEGIMSEISASYAQELESDLKIASSLIEPMVILILGVVIGTIVISMLLPIFQINILAK